MPRGYLKMKRSMCRGKKNKKLCTKHASMTWNKRMKGTGRTVGRGRR